MEELKEDFLRNSVYSDYRQLYASVYIPRPNVNKGYKYSLTSFHVRRSGTSRFSARALLIVGSFLA